MFYRETWQLSAKKRLIKTQQCDRGWRKPPRPTCVPDILDPYIGAGGEKQPLDGDEEEADDV